MHPIKRYHHFLTHSNFHGECTACAHTHPDLQNEIYLLGGGVALLAWLLLRK